jgi:hypothetical protein
VIWIAALPSESELTEEIKEVIKHADFYVETQAVPTKEEQRQ